MKKIIKAMALMLVFAMLAVPVCAENFTPSVEQKGAPVLKPAPNAPDGCMAVICDGEDTVTKNVPIPDIIVTPLADAETAPEAVREEMKAAYNSIAGAASLADAVPDLQKALEDRESKLTADDLVVRDLVNVQLTEEYAQELAKPDHSITLTFQMDLEPDDFLMVMCYVDGEWVILEPDQVEIGEDGSVSVTFYGHVGTIAFVTEKSER